LIIPFAYSEEWWNTSFIYKKELNLINYDSSLPINYSINISIDTQQLVAEGKLNANCDDLRIVYYNNSEYVELERYIENECNAVNTTLWFNTYDIVSANTNYTNYSIYYGNSGADKPDELQLLVNFSDYPILSYGGSQDANSANYEILENGHTLYLWGNNWKAINKVVSVQSDTILDFEFRSNGVAAEINGVGFDTDLSLSANRLFKLHGTQTWGIGTYNNYVQPDWKRYEIKVFEHYTGNYNYIMFANDADTGQATNVYYRNLKIRKYVDNEPGFLFSEEERFDIDAPLVNEIILSPDSEDAIDPNVSINVSANITDAHNISIVIFQYKGDNTSEWTDVSMKLSNGLYSNASFIPDYNGTWFYRIWANDSLGNSGYSNISNISVQFDRSWNSLPISLPMVHAEPNVSVSLGNITINNTGDFILNINVSSSSNDTSYGNESDYVIMPGDSGIISVYDRSLIGGIKTISLNITAEGADPGYRIIERTIITASGMPVLVANIVAPSYNKIITKGDTAVTFVVKIENQGLSNASNISTLFTLPVGWEQNSDLAIIEQLSIGEYMLATAEFDILEEAAAGTQDIRINISGYNVSSIAVPDSYIFEDFTRVEVRNLGSYYTEEVSQTAGTATYGQISRVDISETLDAILSDEKLVEIDDPVEFIKGRDNTFNLEIKNIFNEVRIKDIKIEGEGLLSTAIEHLSEDILLEPGESESVDVSIGTLNAIEVGDYALPLKISGTLEGAGILKPFTLTEHLRIALHRVSELEAIQFLDRSVSTIDEMDKKGYPILRLSERLKDASNSLKEKEYERVKEISEEILEMREQAITANSLIEDIKAEIKPVPITGAVVGTDRKFEEAQNLLDTALLAFEMEHYDLALEIANDAKHVLDHKDINLTPLYFFVLLFVLIVATAGFVYFRYGKKKKRK
jgi:hypothetical protein